MLRLSYVAFAIFAISLSGCSSTQDELKAIAISVNPNSTILDVEKALGEPAIKYTHNDFSVLYYCQNSKWNELSKRHLWFNGNKLIHDQSSTSRGVACDKGIPKPSFSGVAFNNFDLFLPTSTRYGQDGLKVCTDALSSPLYNNTFTTVAFDFESPLFSIVTGSYDYDNEILNDEEVKSYQSFLTLLNECRGIAPKRQNKFLKSEFGVIPNEIFGIVSYEINTLLEDRRKETDSILISLINREITLKNAEKRMLEIEQATKEGKRMVLNYIADFRQKVAIAHAGKTVIKNTTKVRVTTDSGIIPRCRMGGTC